MWSGTVELAIELKDSISNLFFIDEKLPPAKEWLVAIANRAKSTNAICFEHDARCWMEIFGRRLLKSQCTALRRYRDRKKEDKKIW